MITEAAPATRGRARWTEPGRLWAAWAATRAATLLILIPEHKVLGDVRYYFSQVDALFHGAALGGVLREYPVPAVWFLALPRLVSGHWVLAYLAAFVLLMLAVDATVAGALFRAAGSQPGAAPDRPAPGVLLWLWVLPLLGPMILCRFDLLPAALAAGALLLVSRRPALSGTLLGLGAAVKLWPAALLPSLWLHRMPTAGPANRDGGGRDADVPGGTGTHGSLPAPGSDTRAGSSAGEGPRGGRWRLVGAFAAVAVGIAVLVAAIAGGTRLQSPLHWQGERGLQIEAYAALPLLVADLFRPDLWHVEYTRFYAFQVYGPGTATALTAATASSVLAVLLLAVLWLRAARLRGALPPGVPGLLGVLTVSLMAVTDKTLSPQYLIWIAALLAVVGVTAAPALPRGANAVLLLTCALTQVIFPLNYDPLVAGEPYAVLLLLARDALLLALAWLVGRQVWALTRAPSASGAPGAPGASGAA